MQHDIKIEPSHIQAVIDRKKNFEVRCNDRGYNAGDTIVMTETGWPRRKVSATIGYVTAFQQKDNWVVFSLLDVKEIDE